MRMNFKDRIKQFCDSIGFSIREFERACGLTRGNISNMTGAIGSDKLAKIIDTYPELNLYWLVTGDGDMIRDCDPNPPQTSKDSLDLELCRALLKEKDTRLEEQAREIGRLEERLSNFQTPREIPRQYGAVLPAYDTDGIPTDIPAMQDVPIPSQPHGVVKDALKSQETNK